MIKINFIPWVDGPSSRTPILYSGQSSNVTTDKFILFLVGNPECPQKFLIQQIHKRFATTGGSQRRIFCSNERTKNDVTDFHYSQQIV